MCVTGERGFASILSVNRNRLCFFHLMRRTGLKKVLRAYSELLLDTEKNLTGQTARKNPPFDPGKCANANSQAICHLFLCHFSLNPYASDVLAEI